MPQDDNNKKNKHYPPDSAGRFLVERVPTARPSDTIADVERMLLRDTKNLDTINYIYVVDGSKRLEGVISVKDIFCLSKKMPVKEAMRSPVVSVRAYTDREHAALLALEHNIKAVPVINKEGILLGVVPPDTILDILHQENIEDILRSAGIHNPDSATELINAPTLEHFKRRLPWLIVGLLGGILAAFVVGFFEEALETQIMLAAFIPAVVYMADAVGAQSQTIFIRSMALDKKLDLKKYVWREAKVNTMLGAVLGVLFFVIIFLFWHIPQVAIIIGLSIFTTVLISMMVSMFLPWIFDKFKSDPAISSGPFGTALRDLSSLLIYFSIASVMLNFFA